jgi:hypothetical protein
MGSCIQARTESNSCPEGLNPDDNFNFYQNLGTITNYDEFRQKFPTESEADLAYEKLDE